jgi:hypothetical protein
MKKLSLNIDELSIQSFETMGNATPRGTVHAKRSEIWATCEEGDLSYPGSCEIQTCDEYCADPTYTTCPNATQGPTCRQSDPSPFGTCCHITC